jgi:DNA-binding beta-propeller fold protein YncE
MDEQSQRLFAPAPRDGIVEIVDVRSGRLWHSLKIPNPTAALYVPEFKQLYLTSGQSVYIYDGKSFDTVGHLDLQTRLDQLRFDPPSRRLYVGCMGQDGGTAIAVIAIPEGKLQWKIALPDSPQGIAVERNGVHIFASLPDLNSIAVIDRRQRKVIANWTLGDAHANFPISLDQSGHRLFVACRSPAEMLVLDSRTGRPIARVPCVGDADDMWYDASGKCIYITGGEGFVSIIQQQTADRYRLLQQVATAPGAATSVLSRKLNSLFVSVPRRENQPSEILVYETAH